RPRGGGPRARPDPARAAGPRCGARAPVLSRRRTNRACRAPAGSVGEDARAEALRLRRQGRRRADHPDGDAGAAAQGLRQARCERRPAARLRGMGDADDDQARRRRRQRRADRRRVRDHRPQATSGTGLLLL
ncbi:MAG: hypothetical protein AVDCRST_MAG39-1556, partial [uncultured Sphingomonadaceae bacterium]